MKLANTVIHVHNTSAFNVLRSCTFICSSLLISNSLKLVMEDTHYNNYTGMGYVDTLQCVNNRITFQQQYKCAVKLCSIYFF